MIDKKIFSSNISFQDAALKAQREGYQIVGQGRGNRGEFRVFGRKQVQQPWNVNNYI